MSIRNFHYVMFCIVSALFVTNQALFPEPLLQNKIHIKTAYYMYFIGTVTVVLLIKNTSLNNFKIIKDIVDVAVITALLIYMIIIAWEIYNLPRNGLKSHLSSIETVNLLKENGDTTAIGVISPSSWTRSPGDDNFAPLGDVSNSTIVYCKEAGERVIYKSDQFGFRNNPSWWIDTETLFIGDSFTQGGCVKDDATMTSLFNNWGKKTVSLGKGGTSTLIQLATVNEYIQQINPSELVLFFFQNDFYEISKEADNDVFGRYLKTRDLGLQNLANRQDEINIFLKKNYQIIEETKQNKFKTLLQPFRGYYTYRLLRKIRDSKGGASIGKTLVYQSLSKINEIAQKKKYKGLSSLPT